MTKPNKAEPPICCFNDTIHWEQWLAANQEDVLGIWMKIAKKGSGIDTVSYQQALRVALCYGWIDGQKQKFDGQYWLQRFTPRRASSIWSQRNVGIVEELIVAGQMQPRGLLEMATAQADGRWENAYASTANIEVPEDFQVALAAQPQAREFFDTLTKSRRYSFLYRIETSKRPETRQRWIARAVEMLSNQETFR